MFARARERRDRTASSNMTLFVTVLEVNGVRGQQPSRSSVNGTFTPGVQHRPADLPGHVRSGRVGGDRRCGDALGVGTRHRGNATKVRVALDNDLFVLSESGTTAKLQKKVADGVVVTVPEPASFALLALGCFWASGCALAGRSGGGAGSAERTRQRPETSQRHVLAEPQLGGPEEQPDAEATPLGFALASAARAVAAFRRPSTTVTILGTGVDFLAGVGDDAAGGRSRADLGGSDARGRRRPARCSSRRRSSSPCTARRQRRDVVAS